MEKVTMTVVMLLALLSVVGCAKDDLSNYSLGSETYPDYPDCKQVYFNRKPIPAVFLKKLNKAAGDRVEGVACHGVTVVVDAKTGRWQDGSL